MMEKDLSNVGPGRLVSGGVWFLGLMILSGVFWLLLGIQVSRVYGPSGFGLFSMAYSVFDFLWALIFGGLFEGLIHFGAGYLTKKDANLARYFSNYVRYLTVISLVIFIFLAVLSFQTSDIIFRIMLLSLAFAFLFSGTKDSLSSIIGSLHKSKQLSIIQSSGFYAVSIIGTIFAMLALPTDLLPVLVVVAPICQLLLCTYFLRPYIKDLISYNIDLFTNKNREYSVLEDLKQFKHILIFGFSISVGKISFMIMKSLDIPILNLFFDYANVGVYSVADAVSSVLFSMTAFSLPILSSMSEAWSKKDDALMEKYVKISVKYPLLLGLPLTIIIFALAEPIVVGIYGTVFRGAVLPLQILIIGTFLLMFGRTLSSILIGIGKAKLSGMLLAGAATQYLVSLFILVPIFGLDGAAISLTLTGVTSLILIPLFIKRHLKVDVFSGLHKILFSGAILAGILFIIPKSNSVIVILGLIASIAVYVILLYYTGYVNQEDIKILKTARAQS
ncbi:MAG: polysaccharide biosynthesis C-terminal domain-containing protein [Candidatus Bathyarchaeota archaeon]|jgi:O-antigen/teichoic acid export membrane protein